MIPDKIYSVIILDDSTPGNTRGAWSCVEVEGALNTEYIRKDALLEWKEELEEHVRKCAGGIVGQYEHGYWKALDDLIDKLNEM